MFSRGQGTFEYVLLLGTVLLIVVLAIILIRGGFDTGAQDVRSKSCETMLAKQSACVSGGVWHSDGVVLVSSLPIGCNVTLGAKPPYSCTDTHCSCGPQPA